MIRAALITESPMSAVNMISVGTCSYASNISTPVIPSNTIQTTVNVLMVAPCGSACSAYSLINLLNLGRHQIYQREDKHPDQIHEVPVQSTDLYIFMLEFAPAHT